MAILIESRLDAIDFLLQNSEVFTHLRSLVAKYPFDFEMSLTSAIHQRIAQDKYKLCLNTLNCIASSLASVSLSGPNWPSLLKNIIEELIGQICC